MMNFYDISPNIRLGKQESLHVSSDTFYRSCFTLMPYQQIKRRHHVTFLRRGAYDLGNAALTTGDIFGLCRFSRNQDLSAPVFSEEAELGADTHLTRGSAAKILYQAAQARKATEEGL